MRSALLVAATTIALLAAPSTSAQDVPLWSAEFGASVINPLGSDGTLALSSSSTAGEHGVDFASGLAPTAGIMVEPSEQFSFGVSLSIATHDVEVDIAGTGTFELGDTTLVLVEISGLWEVYRQKDVRLHVGPLVGYGAFEDVSLGTTTIAQGVTSTTLDNDMLLGATVRYDQPIGGPSWAFYAELNYMSGGPRIVVSTDGSGAIASGSVATDFDPLSATVGLGYRFGN